LTHNKSITPPRGTPPLVQQQGTRLIDWDEFFQALADVGFDEIATCAVFSWAENFDADGPKELKKIQDHFAKVGLL
jgi:hypothetical protein